MAKLQLIEAQAGKPIKEVLIDLYQKHGTQEGVAAALGVSQGMVAMWITANNLEVRRTLVEKKEKTA